MIEKNTKELEEILKSTHVKKAAGFLKENKDSMYTNEYEFSNYMRDLIKCKSISQQRVFIDADLPERYGYKLLSGEKRTKQRDVILRLCYASNFSLDETQKVLKLYEMPQLYAKIPRDAMIMMCFNSRPGSVIDVNNYLRENKFEPLRSCGVQE